jgi:hypothetical protein
MSWYDQQGRLKPGRVDTTKGFIWNFIHYNPLKEGSVICSTVESDLRWDVVWLRSFSKYVIGCVILFGGLYFLDFK